MQSVNVGNTSNRAFVLLLFLPFLACNREISGGYLASDNESVCWLQLVRTPDNHLNGDMNCSTMKKDGSINRRSQLLTGSVNSTSLTLSGNSFLGIDTQSFSGTFTGSSLQLLDQNSAALVFKRSESSDYQGLLKEQALRAQNVVASLKSEQVKERTMQRQQETNEVLSATLLKVRNFNSEAAVRLSEMNKYSRAYPELTDQVAKYTTISSQASTDSRSNIRVTSHLAAERAARDTENVHQQLENLKQSFSLNIEPLKLRVEGLSQFCRDRSHTQPLTEELNATLRDSECRSLLEQANSFQHNYDLTAIRFKELDQLYVKTSERQQTMLAAY